MKSAIILGLMSGTSLDGLDLCLTQFEFIDGKHKFRVLKSQSISYPKFWQKKLQNATSLSGENLKKLDIEVGKYFGYLVNNFINNCSVQPDYISSHGHTIFHQPNKGITMQIGDGFTMFTQIKIPVIYNFRQLDVALNGQGAPLVPIGDLHLFNHFAACINFGGITNISFQKLNERLAFDICPMNMALSDITSEINLPFDDKGRIAKKGTLNLDLLNKLNSIEYYTKTGPKSMGIEWYVNNVKPLIKNKVISIEDRLRTMTEHITEQVTNVLSEIENGEVLVTGGGTYNSFLIELLKSKSKQKIIIPSIEIIEFKEALIFAFLGWLKINNQLNVLKSVTGAIKDSCSGVLIQ